MKLFVWFFLVLINIQGVCAVGAGSTTAPQDSDFNDKSIKKDVQIEYSYGVDYEYKASVNDDSPTYPENGYWLISSATEEQLVGAVVTIQKDRFLIPSCGLLVINEAQRQEKKVHGIKEITAPVFFDPRRYLGPSLCKQASKNWKFAKVSGDEKTIELTFYDVQNNPVPVFGLYMWNLDKGTPHDTGSGYGSSIAMYMELTIMDRVFTYAIANSQIHFSEQKKLFYTRAFNLPRFSKKIKKYCEAREAESGGGHWPAFWQQSCQLEQLNAKFEIFRNWQVCITKKQKGCVYPNEKLEDIPDWRQR